MIRFILLLALGVTLFLAGCSPAFVEEPVDTAPLELEGEWSVKMTQSGGIMGLMRSVEVSSDGNFTIDDERLARTVTGKLPNAEMQTLQKLVAESEFRIRGNQDSICADCFVYQVEIQSGGQTFTAQVDDVTMSDSELEPLVMFLRSVMDANIR
ncbi:MAG TPA: hypothetical protein PLF42_00510 [Anaerolineales bacterium]|nr:hypothetical protein [Anaerolineales bacterium]